MIEKHHILYKDERYLVELYINANYAYIDSSITIKEPRKGFWSYIFPYKVIVRKKNLERQEAKNTANWVKLIEDFLRKSKYPNSPTILINCSDDIKLLYPEVKTLDYETRT